MRYQIKQSRGRDARDLPGHPLTFLPNVRFMSLSVRSIRPCRDARAPGGGGEGGVLRESQLAWRPLVAAVSRRPR